MKLTIFPRITGAALLAVLATPAQNIAQGEQEHKREHFPHYRVKDLGTLGGTFSQAFGINSRGHVGGGCEPAQREPTRLPLDPARWYAGPRHVRRPE